MAEDVVAAGLMPGRAGGGGKTPRPGRPPQPPEPPPSPPGGPDEPEDTATYEEFLGTILNAIYDEKVAAGMAPVFQSPTPVETLALYVSGAVGRAAYSGLENGQNITREMAVAATAQISEDIGTELAQAVGAQPLNDEQIQALFLRSVELLADQRDDRQMTDMAGEGMPPEGGEEAPQGPGGGQGPRIA